MGVVKKIFLMGLILLGIIQILNAKSVLQNKTDNSVELSIDKAIKQEKIIIVLSDKEKISELKSEVNDISKKEISINDGQKIDGSNMILLSGKKTDKLKIKDLKPQYKYFLSIFSANDKKLIEEINFTTLAKEPAEQAKNVIFKNIKNDNVTLLFNKGKGANRLIFVTMDGKPALPEDGKNYKASNNYGDSISQVSGTTYCIHNGNDKEVLVTRLNHAEYTFQIFEYNGDGETANYLPKTDAQNPRSKLMPLPPPEAYEAISITSNGFTARWEAMKGPLMFLLDISTEENFVSFVEPYNNMDVGSISEMEVVDLEPGIYYYRIRAFTDKVKSDNSNIIKVEIKE
jgi:hypothetical protein